MIQYLMSVHYPQECIPLSSTCAFDTVYEVWVTTKASNYGHLMILSKIFSCKRTTVGDNLLVIEADEVASEHSKVFFFAPLRTNCHTRIRGTTCRTNQLCQDLPTFI